MKYHAFTFEGKLNFRLATLDVLCLITYGEAYLDLTEMQVYSDRKRGMIPASDRLMVKFQEAHWDYLYSKCLQNDAAMAEMYRDMRDDIGDMKHESRKAACV